MSHIVFDLVADGRFAHTASSWREDDEYGQFSWALDGAGDLKGQRNTTQLVSCHLSRLRRCHPMPFLL